MIWKGQASQSLANIADNTGIQVNRMKGSYTQIAAFAKTTGMDTSSALGLADRAMVAVADSAAFMIGRWKRPQNRCSRF